MAAFLIVRNQQSRITEPYFKGVFEMAGVKKKLEITIDVDNPIEEIKECIITVSMFQGAQQLNVLKEVELWLGKTIEDAESKKQNQESSQGSE